MKKSIIALAALASLTAAGTAAAQSSVTLYGRMDASIGSERVDDVSTTKLYSGNLTTSRLGFRGSEDLGGGLKANFQLEAARSPRHRRRTGTRHQHVFRHTYLPD
jgi:predicted porin